MIPKNFLQPIEKLSTGKIGNSEGYSWIKGQILRGHLLVDSISMNECDYESFGIVKYVVYVHKLIKRDKIKEEQDVLQKHFIVGNIVKNVGKDAFVENPQGEYVRDNMVFSLYSLIISGSTPILCEHEIPKDEPIETQRFNNWVTI